MNENLQRLSIQITKHQYNLLKYHQKPGVSISLLVRQALDKHFAEADQILGEARSAADEARASASAEIGVARQQALMEIESTAADLAKGIAGKLLESGPGQGGNA